MSLTSVTCMIVEAVEQTSFCGKVLGTWRLSFVVSEFLW